MGHGGELGPMGCALGIDIGPLDAQGIIPI